MSCSHNRIVLMRRLYRTRRAHRHLPRGILQPVERIGQLPPFYWCMSGRRKCRVLPCHSLRKQRSVALPSDSESARSHRIRCRYRSLIQVPCSYSQSPALRFHVSHSYNNDIAETPIYILQKPRPRPQILRHRKTSTKPAGQGRERLGVAIHDCMGR